MKGKDIEQIKQYISHTLCHPMNNGLLVSLYYQIGFYLFEHHISIHTLKRIEWELKNEYGIVIGFTRRNLILMMQFYSVYDKSRLNYLKAIPWHQHLYLLKNKKFIRRKYVLVKHSDHKKIECKKKSLSFIQIDYMLTEIQTLQQKLASKTSFACYNKKGGR